MSSEIITQTNLGSIDWHEDCFKYCEFRDFEWYSSEIDSIFLSCIFVNLDWYGGLFNICVFVGCEFQNCIFRGTAFPDCKFVECSFTNCQFVKNNMNRDCHFEGAVAYACSFENVDNFRALSK